MPPKPAPGKPDTAKKGRRKSTMGPLEFDEDADDDEWGQGKTAMKIDDEPLALTEMELKQEITRVLAAENPQIIKNTVIFSYKDMSYKPIPVIDHLVIHLEMQSKLAHKDSEEAKLMAARGITEEILEPTPAATTDEKEGETTPGEKEPAPDAAATEGIPEGAEGEAEAPPAQAEAPPVQEEAAAAPQASTAPPPAAGSKKLTNKFNFCDRAAQTYNNPIRTRGTQTVPPSRRVLVGSVSQWEVYDAYASRAEAEERLKEKVKASKPKESQKKQGGGDVQGNQLTKVTMPIKTIERMITQNIYDEVIQDFKYYEDIADEYRDQQGTLLPLWKFTHEQAKLLAVTSLSWCPRYKDLFAASYGSYDYMKQLHGMICIFTMKNPTYPEYLYMVDSGVLTIDTNPNLPHLIAAGYYDGSVAVYSLKDIEKTPRFLCNPKEGKHQDPTWQVKWQKDNLDGNLNFISVSSDGRVTNWVLQKTAMTYTDVLHLKLENVPLVGPEGTFLDIKSCGTSVAFHKTKENMFLIGTEEGLIHRGSKVYSNRFLMTYPAHSMTVCRIQWNPFHPQIFISCSADWRVKIWNYLENKPYFIFDLGCPVGDVVWSPYAGTVFSAGAADGKVYIYDLNVNKYKPICEQIVVQKKNTRITSLAFNMTYPILLAGDSRGCVTSLKLSPNLRKALKENKTTDPVKFAEMEVNKLNKIMAVVKDTI